MSKLEEKELKELRESITKPNQIATEIGMRVIAYKDIDNLVDAFSKASKEQQELMKSIEEKHGKGSLNIDTGEITPIEE
jgi:heterodisulfide reductase subunit B